MISKSPKKDHYCFILYILYSIIFVITVFIFLKIKKKEAEVFEMVIIIDTAYKHDFESLK